MKSKTLLLTLFLLIAPSAYARFGVGMRDNRFVYGDFTFKNHYEVKLEQSVFSEKLGYQHLRGYLGYKGDSRNFDYSARAYFGSTYNGSYHDYGVLAELKYTFIDRIMIEGKLNPHYDSGCDYETCFYAGAGVVITKNIDVHAGYTTIPEYRMSEKRLYAGFDFHVGSLSATPAVSIAVSDAEKGKTTRVLMGFRYQF